MKLFIAIIFSLLCLSCIDRQEQVIRTFQEAYTNDSSILFGTTGTIYRDRGLVLVYTKNNKIKYFYLDKKDVIALGFYSNQVYYDWCIKAWKALHYDTFGEQK